MLHESHPPKAISVEGRQHLLLELAIQIGGVLPVGQCPQSNSPQPIAVSTDKFPERVPVTSDVGAEQTRVVDVNKAAGHGQNLSVRRDPHWPHPGSMACAHQPRTAISLTVSLNSPGSGCGSLVIQTSRYCTVCLSSGTGSTMFVPG